MPGREYSDEALREQLAAFLDYRSRGGPYSLVRWMDEKDFSPADRARIEVFYMGWMTGQVSTDVAS
jgi:hypothetical protein